MPKPKISFELLYENVLGLIRHHKPEAINYSKISRASGIPRPTLYYYFGKEPDALIEESLRFGMSVLTQIYQDDTHSLSAKTWGEYHHARFYMALKLVMKHPWAIPLYLRYRNQPGRFQKSIKNIEDRYLERMSAQFKKQVGKAADPERLRLAGYLKIGFFWGMTTDQEAWSSKERAYWKKTSAEFIAGLDRWLGAK